MGYLHYILFFWLIGDSGFSLIKKPYVIAKINIPRFRFRKDSNKKALIKIIALKKTKREYWLVYTVNPIGNRMNHIKPIPAIIPNIPDVSRN